MRPLVDNKIFMPSLKSDCYVGMLIQEWALRYLSIQIMCADKEVLDVGCKYGYGSLLLAQWAKRVVGCDLKNRLQTDVDFVQADFLDDNIPFNKEFDIVNCMEVIEHVKKPEKIIKNCHKAIRDGGLLILTTPARDRQVDEHVKLFYTKDEVISLISPLFDVLFLREQFDVSWLYIGKAI